MIDKITRSPEDIGLRRFPKFMGVILAEVKIAVKRFSGRRRLLCSQSFVPIEAVVERGNVAADVKTTVGC
jgi:hypothetical protein